MTEEYSDPLVHELNKILNLNDIKLANNLLVLARDAKGCNDQLSKKQSVLKKIAAFVEKFKGVGGEI
jgi:hypothetical protein